MRARPSVVVLSALVLACGGNDAPRVHVATAGSDFIRRGSDASLAVLVPFTITNRGQQTIYVPACGNRPMVTIDRGNGSGWEQYGGTRCIDIYLQVPIELRAGQSVSDSYAMSEAGTYRVRVSYSLTRSSFEKTEAAASGAFEVR